MIRKDNLERCRYKTTLLLIFCLEYGAAGGGNYEIDPGSDRVKCPKNDISAFGKVLAETSF